MNCLKVSGTKDLNGLAFCARDRKRDREQEINLPQKEGHVSSLIYIKHR